VSTLDGVFHRELRLGHGVAGRAGRGGLLEAVDFVRRQIELVELARQLLCDLGEGLLFLTRRARPVRVEDRHD
jgi:hypothetical protein